MKDETLDTVLDALDDEMYITKRVLRNRTSLSNSATENAIELLLEDEEIESIKVKNGIGKGRAEVAYRRIAEWTYTFTVYAQGR